MVFAFACLIRFYHGQWKGMDLPLNDDKAIIDNFKKLWNLPNLSSTVHQVLGNIDYWDTDLNNVDGLPEAIEEALKHLEADGVEDGFKEFVDSYK